MRAFENRQGLVALGCATVALLGSCCPALGRPRPQSGVAGAAGQGKQEMLRIVAAFLRREPANAEVAAPPGVSANAPVDTRANAVDRTTTGQQDTTRYAPLLPYRGGVERVRAYTRYIVTATHDCRHRLDTARADRIARALLASADKQGLDPRLLAAMVQRESDFNTNETSRCGAKGLGQLTHWDDGGVDCYNVEANLAQSAKNLKGLLKKFGSPELALAAYNAGEEAVQRHHGIPPYPETRAHVRVVMGIYRNISRLRREVSSAVRSAPLNHALPIRMVRVAQHSW